MAIQEKFPSIRPSLNLDFANTKTLDPRVTFSRASTATYYDGKTVAKAEENLLLRSQEFDNASWSKFFAGGVTIDVTANAGVAPDGTTTADRITTTGDASALQLGPTLVSGVDYTISMWVKRAGASDQTFRLSINNGSTSAYSGNLTATDTWQRFSYTVTSVGTSNSAHRTGITRDSSNSAYDVLVWGAQLEQRSQATAYTATTSQPITNYVPVLRTAAANVARFDHNPVTGESLGLLIEEQRTNLVLRSQEFGDAYWSKTNSSITANAVVAPDGTLTADKLVDNTTSGVHNIFRNYGAITPGSFAASCYVKASEYSKLVAYLDNQSGLSFAYSFDLLAGTATQTRTPHSSWTGVSAVIAAVGNGWYRVAISGTTTNTLLGLRLSLDKGTTYDGFGLPAAFAGDGYSGIYIWGAQLEAGAFPTSYIKTEASQVTRSADNASMTGTNFSSWFRQDEGSFCAEFSVNALRQAMIFSSGGRGIGIQPGGQIQVGVYNVGDQTSPQAIVTAVGNPYKVALVHDSKEMGGYGYSGSFVSGKSSNYIVPTNTSLVLGSQGTQRWLNGHIRKIAYYPKRLSNTQLQALTS